MFFNKDGVCVLEVGSKDRSENQEILLNDGERLLGVRSQSYLDEDSHRAYHCNM